MGKWCALLMTIALTGCGEPPVVTAIDTLCTVTTRYHATDDQVAAFKADRLLWEPLVNWMLAFNKERDRRCLQSAAWTGLGNIHPFRRWDAG